jgi:hypothetical protein
LNSVKHALAQALGPLALIKMAGTAVATANGGSGSGVIGSAAKGAVLGGAGGAAWQALKKPAQGAGKEVGKKILKGGKMGALAGGAILGGLALVKKLKN